MKDKIFGIVIAVVFFLFSLFTINDYGVTWDEPRYFESGKNYVAYLRGEAKLNFSSTGNIQYYGPFTDMISYLNYELLNKNLKIFDEIPSRHIHLIILASITLLIVYLFMLQAFNKTVAIFSSISLALFPQFIGHAQNNMKDIPVTAFFVLMIWSFYKFLKTKSWKWLLCTGIFFGFGFSSKIQIVFAPLILIIWLIIICYGKKIDKKTIIKGFKNLFFVVFVAFLISMLTWPWLWQDTFNKIISVFNWFLNIPGEGTVIYLGKEYTAETLPFHYPLVMLSITTPLITLIFALIGFFICLKKTVKKEGNIYSLLVIWVMIILLIQMLPFITKYDGIRQFFQIMPVICILSGLGIDFFLIYLTNISKKLCSSKYILLIFLLVYVMPLIINIIKFHPYETVYFNELIGGINGVQGKFELDYWGNSYKEGALWLNKNAENNSYVVAPMVPEIIKYFTRSDLKVGYFIELAKGNITNFYYIFFIRFNYNPFPNLEPIFSVKRENVKLLKIYKFSVVSNKDEKKSYIYVYGKNESLKLDVDDYYINDIGFFGEEKGWRNKYLGKTET